MRKRIASGITALCLSLAVILGSAAGAGAFGENQSYRVFSVGAGFDHAVAVTGDGQLWSWGYNDTGALGLGHTMTVTLPSRINLEGNFIAASSGLYHSMALDGSGKIYAWGSNIQGQLGLGASGGGYRLTPQEVGLAPFDGKVVAISAGYYNSLALTDAGSVYSWGDNALGTTGLGTSLGYTSTPAKVSLPEAITAISAGYSTGMALGASGAVYTWGYGGYGALGIGSLLDKNTPQAVTLPADAARISNNGYHMMALLSTGELYAWGKNDMGEVGSGGSAHKSAPQHVTVPLDAGDRIVKIDAGYEHSSVLTMKGKLYSWGAQTDGRLGNGATSGYQRTPLYIRDKVADIEGGGAYRYQIVIAEGGTAWAAGHDLYGTLGNDKNVGSLSGSSGAQKFVLVEIYPERFLIKSVAAGFSHSAAIAADGTVWTWGYNEHGELGNGNDRDRTLPEIVSQMTCRNIVSVAAGLYHTMALSSDGRLFVWGHNNQGQLGLGAKGGGDRLAPQEVGLAPFDGKVVAISAGYYNSLALTDAGSVYSWGDNALGTTGLGTSLGYAATPAKVSLPEAITAIAGGYSTGMALGESGAVYTWGYGGYGALGIGSLLDKNTPQTVALPAPATKISNNGYHMMALLSTGDLYAWGKNDMGEVGIGGAAHKHAPQHIAVPLDAGDAIASINAGYEHSAVLTEAGKLYAWGSMGDGRLGDGSKTGYQRTPKYIRDGVASIEGCGAYRHQFVIDESGAAWGAGIDAHGQLGNDRDLGLTGRQTDELGFVPVEFFAESGGVRW